ncbi:unnamed protein product [Closterium sp. NIES-64]|nr:unnamed protein product [Closterium sp. NIES-64]
MGPKGLVSRLLAPRFNDLYSEICLPLPSPLPPFPPCPQRPTIALVMGPKGLITPKCDDSGSLVMGPKGLISRLLASRFNDRPTIALNPTIALVMGLKGLISSLLAPKFIGVCPAFALDIGPKGLISRLLAPKSSDVSFKFFLTLPSPPTPIPHRC